MIFNCKYYENVVFSLEKVPPNMLDLFILTVKESFHLSSWVIAESSWGEPAPHSTRQSHSKGACKKKTILYLINLSSTPLLTNLKPLIANMNSKFANIITCVANKKCQRFYSGMGEGVGSPWPWILCLPIQEDTLPNLVNVRWLCWAVQKSDSWWEGAMFNETPDYRSLPVDSGNQHVSVNSASKRIIIPRSGFFGMIQYLTPPWRKPHFNMWWDDLPEAARSLSATQLWSLRKTKLKTTVRWTAPRDFCKLSMAMI